MAPAPDGNGILEKLIIKAQEGRARAAATRSLLPPPETLLINHVRLERRESIEKYRAVRLRVGTGRQKIEPVAFL